MNPIELSVILPVYNEADCIEAVVREIDDALKHAADITTYEIVAVNDGSTDDTRAILATLQTTLPTLVVRDTRRNLGQSAALGLGIRAARGELLCTMDADGQNNPRDIAACVDVIRHNAVDACCGWRQNRQDTFSKRLGSRLANAIRRAVLDDGITDTGCAMRVIRAEYLKPLCVWDGMHRFLPALVKMQGGRILQIPVDHRLRTTGTSKYTNLSRLRKTAADLRGMRWLTNRHITLITESENQ